MGKDCDRGQRLGNRRQHAERLQVALRPRRRIQGKLLLSDFPAEQTTCRRQAAHLGNHAAIVRTWKSSPTQTSTLVSVSGHPIPLLQSAVSRTPRPRTTHVTQPVDSQLFLAAQDHAFTLPICRRSPSQSLCLSTSLHGQICLLFYRSGTWQVPAYSCSTFILRAFPFSPLLLPISPRRRPPLAHCSFRCLYLLACAHLHSFAHAPYTWARTRLRSLDWVAGNIRSLK
jgi:hypothetical protein